MRRGRCGSFILQEHPAQGLSIVTTSDSEGSKVLADCGPVQVGESGRGIVMYNVRVSMNVVRES